MKTSARGDSLSNMEIRSGTVQAELDGTNLIQADQDGTGNAVNLADGVKLDFYDADGNGSIKLHGAFNYWGGKDRESTENKDGGVRRYLSQNKEVYCTEP